MSNVTHLLDDPDTAAAIRDYCALPPGHRVIGLHDGVEVHGWAPWRLSTPPRRAIVLTVEVVVATRTGRVYAHRYAVNLAAFLSKATSDVTAAKSGRRSAA